MREWLQRWWAGLEFDYRSRRCLWVAFGSLVVLMVFGADPVPEAMAAAGDGGPNLAVAAAAALLVLTSVGALYYVMRHAIDVSRIRMAEARARREFERDFLQAAATRTPADEQMDALHRRSVALGLPEIRPETVRSAHFAAEVRPVLELIRSTRRYSPAQAEHLLAMAPDLQIDALLANEFRKYRTLWEIESTGRYDPQPLEEGAIRLGPAEVCYFAAPATWSRTAPRHSSGYVSGSLGSQAATRVALRVGRSVPAVGEPDSSTRLGVGMLYITSRKIVFLGDVRSRRIPRSRIRSYELYRNALHVNTRSGTPDVFHMHEDDMLLVDALLQVI